MVNDKKTMVITIIVSMISSGCLFAQKQEGPLHDSVPAALLISKKKYLTQIGYQSRLYNGSKYVDYAAVYYTGSAYFGTADFQNASLHYDGADFYDVPILYDLYRDMIVVKQPVDSSKINLINIKLDKFSIGNHHFVRVGDDRTEKSMTAGFYELLYDGKSQILKRYTKTILEEKMDLHIQTIFKEHVAYYLLKDGVYNPLSGVKSLLHLLKSKGKELQGYMGISKISLTTENQEQALVNLLAYYDQLNRY